MGLRAVGPGTGVALVGPPGVLGCVGAGGCGVGWCGATLRLYLLPGLEPNLVASTSTRRGQPVVLVVSIITGLMKGWRCPSTAPSPSLHAPSLFLLERRNAVPAGFNISCCFFQDNPGIWPKRRRDLAHTDLGDLLGSLLSFLCISSVAMGSVLGSPPCQSTHQHRFNPIDLICERFPPQGKKHSVCGCIKVGRNCVAVLMPTVPLNRAEVTSKPTSLALFQGGTISKQCLWELSPLLGVLFKRNMLHLIVLPA